MIWIIKKKETNSLKEVRVYKCENCHSTYAADKAEIGSEEITHCPICKGCYNKPVKFSKFKVWFYRLIKKIY